MRRQKRIRSRALSASMQLRKPRPLRAGAIPAKEFPSCTPSWAPPGHTGTIITEQLLAAGQKVRAIGHNPKHLERLTAKGAEPHLADATDAGALTKAFTGATAVYVLLPPNISAPDYRAPIKPPSRTPSSCGHHCRARPGHAVALSSCGADKADKVGPVVGLHKLEEKLRAIPDLNVLFLRAGYFMENLLPQIGVIKSQNMLAGCCAATCPWT